MSKLPVLKHPTFEVVIPSTGKKASFRPFTGKEQKILLIAKESGDARDILRATADVVSTCFGVDAASIPVFDLEMMFMALRAKSVNNKIQINIKDEEDGKTYETAVDLDEIEVVPGTSKDRFEIAPGVGIKFRYPTVRVLLDSPSADKIDEWDLLAASVDSIWSGDDITSSSDVSQAELKEWLTTLPLTAIGAIKEFFAGRPQVQVKASYKRADGKVVVKKVTGLGDFFD